jgi:hypothetical protein
MWSDQKTGQGVFTELTPRAWAKVEMKEPILWEFNRFYDPEMAREQHPRVNIRFGERGDSNGDRERIAGTFAQKQEYTVGDAINFLRMQTGPDGTDYSWHGARWPICNFYGTQMVVFDPGGDGFYFAAGPYFTARQDVYHVYSDFSRQPDIFMKAVPNDPRAEEFAKIGMSLKSNPEKLSAMAAMARKYPDDPTAQFLAAYHGFLQSNMQIFREFAGKPYVLDQQNIEYRLFAGMAAYQKKDSEAATRLLESFASDQLYTAEELFRLSVLERVYAVKDAAKSSSYSQIILAILKNYDAVTYFNKEIQPLISALAR